VVVVSFSIFAPVRVLADDREVRVFTPAGPVRWSGPEASLRAVLQRETLSFEVQGRPRRGYGAEMQPKLKVQMLSPCGWVDMKVEVPTAGEAEVRQAVQKGSKPEIAAKVHSDWVPPLAHPVAGFDIGVREDAALAPAPTLYVEGAATGPAARIYIDNRDGAATDVEIGADRRLIEQGAVGEITFLVPKCGEGVAVKLKGESIGQLPPWKQTSTDERFAACEVAPLGSSARAQCSWAFLLDTSGKRCYGLKVMTYGTPGAGTRHRITVVSESATYSHKRWHRLGSNVEYFLEKVPSEVTAPPMMPGDLLNLGELRDSGCRPGESSD